MLKFVTTLLTNLVVSVTREGRRIMRVWKGVDFSINISNTSRSAPGLFKEIESDLFLLTEKIYYSFGGFKFKFVPHLDLLPSQLQVA